MQETLNNIINFLVHTLSVLGPFFGVLLITIESIFPVLPLAAFITLNMITFGNAMGFVLSYFATILGCLISYFAFKKGFSKILYRHVKIDGVINSFFKRIKKLSLPNLSLLIALPFTPAFAVNIAAGLSKMSLKKFMLGLLIGKPFLIYFWGYIGTSLINNLLDINTIIKIILILSVTYAISKLLQIKFKIEE